MKKKLPFLLCALLSVCSVLLITSRIIVARAAKGRTYSDVELIPHRHVGLLLGCPKQLSNGSPNLFFKNRIDAATELYQHEKVDYLILSGDNHSHAYDEPTDMRDALLNRGIPADRIYLDYAGFRTLDSVVRAKEIFNQDTITVISQRFHNQRAIFLAGHRGIDAIGFNAPEVEFRYSFKTRCREQFAKVKAVLDVYLFHKQPHFLGQKVIIGNS
jgi:SanA protein